MNELPFDTKIALIKQTEDEQGKGGLDLLLTISLASGPLCPLPWTTAWTPLAPPRPSSLAQACHYQLPADWLTHHSFSFLS